jgi:hypothetical protein
MKYCDFHKLIETGKEDQSVEYYCAEPAKIPERVIICLNKSPFPEDYALRFENINDLIKPGYLPMEIGYCNLSDASVIVAMLTEMSEITGDMLDWWFWWNPMHPFWYKIIYPQAHFGISLDVDLQDYENRSGPYNQRIYGITSFPEEDIGIGRDILRMHFVHPKEFGFDLTLVNKTNIETIICAEVGSVSKKMKQHGFLCHLARKSKKGIEVRSRCWIGHTIILDRTNRESIMNRVLNKKILKKRLIPENIGYTYAMHCAQELNNLAQILPKLYSAYA